MPHLQPTNHPFRIPHSAFRISRAFTLIELLVVMTIVVLMATLSIPAIKTLTKGNKVAQSTNLIRSYLSNARAIAISEHRMCGIIFFEETSANTIPNMPLHSGQTAMQLIVEDRNQAQYASTKANTIFVYYNKARQYFPVGVQVATINDDPTKMILTGDNTGGASRVILFDATGQMIVRNGIARPDLTGGSADAGYPKAYGDWKLTSKSGAASTGISSPGVIVFDFNDYKDYLANTSPTPTDAQKATWIASHADVIMINAYTGGVIR